MSEYKFGDIKDGNAKGSSRKIPIQDGEIIFNLGAQKEKTKEIQKKNKIPTKTTSQIASSQSPDNSSNLKNKKPGPVKKQNKLFNKIWHTLEFISVSAIIFIIFFFILNFTSYSQLFLTKLNQLRGELNQNPYSQQELIAQQNASKEGQKPLPIAVNTTQAKKQIPPLSMEIAPPDDRVIIPRISQNVPIVQISSDALIRKDWKALESQVQDALRFGVVHYPGTAYPGERGNVVVTGHSSYFPWDPGRFKDVFALLHQVNIGDQVVVYHNQKKYIYQVYSKKVVKPSEIEVLTQAGDTRLTLITCTPVGTDLNRLIVLAKPISVS